MCEETPQSLGSRSHLLPTMCFPRYRNSNCLYSANQTYSKFNSIKHKLFRQPFLLPQQAKGNAVNKWKGSMLPLFPDSQHQMRAQGSVIKENIPDEKLSVAFWKFLIKRAPFACTPTWASDLVSPSEAILCSLFPSCCYLAQRNIRESASISLDTRVERYGQPQGLCLTHHSMQLFRKQENMGQRRRNQQRNKKLKNEKSAEQIHKMKLKKKTKKVRTRGGVQPPSKESTGRSWGA